MIRFATALLLAALAHLVIFVLVGRLLPYTTPPPVPAPELQVTTVELSFSERDATEGAVGASAAPPETSMPVPPAVERRLDPLPELPVRDDGLIPMAPRVQVEANRLAPPELEVPPELETPQNGEVSAEVAPPVEPAPADVPSSESTRETAQVDVPPQPRTQFRPSYPRGARARGEQGIVTLVIEVSAGGRAAAVRVDVSSGFPELDRAAVAAVRRAGFVPASRDGRSVPGTIRLPIDFRLR